MRAILLLTIFCLWLSPVWSKVKIMTFNTMCDLCKGSDYFDYNNRIKALNETVNRHNPSLFALQEVRTKSQVKKVVAGNSNRKILCTDSWLLSYADPAIVYDESVFKLLDEGQAWLGPNPESINVGWKYAIPRQILWGKFKHIKSEKELFFMTGHFDNRIENLTGSAQMVNKILSKQDIPVIFAGDTNLTPNLEIYRSLLGSSLQNVFDMNVEKDLTYAKDEHELCYRKKGSNFPSCRVDHILISKQHKWNLLKYTIDTTKNFNKNFPSDHRPVVLELEL